MNAKKQAMFDFNAGFVKIVKNHWGECYHVSDLYNFTALKKEQPVHFDTAEDARAWAISHGFEVSNRRHAISE